MIKLTIVILLMLVIIPESWATTGTKGVPSSIYHSVRTNAPISVTWTVTGGAGIHVSGEGEFLNPVTNLPINASDNGIGLNISCVVFGQGTTCTSAPETFTIPASVITDAQALGLTTINYFRSFSDGNPSDGIVKINLLNTNLSINRESLYFSDYSTNKLVKPGARITAMADLNYTGNGLLNAFWEVATPTGTNGNIIYTRLRYLNRYLGAGGRVILQSPPLPTLTTGQHIVRLQILKSSSNPNGVEFTSDLPDGLPILRYSVISSAGNTGVNTSLPIKIATPLDNALLQSDTLFRWQPIKNADAYQLELYSLDLPQLTDAEMNNLVINETILENKKPAAGLLIPASTTSLSLSALALNALRSRKTYYWRIIAIGNTGQILSTSQIKKIRTP